MAYQPIRQVCSHSFVRKLLDLIVKGSIMTSRIFLFGLLVVSGLALAVASFDMTKSVLPLLQPGSARQQRDVILSDADEDFDFFQSLKPRSQGQGKSNSISSSLEKYGYRQTSIDVNPEAEKIRSLLLKLQIRSDQFLDIAQRTGYSAVELLIAFSKLVQNSNNKFVIVAQ
ncbi:hypothetical protein pipiens_019136 [Culex pipiens pipiens]|uniref:Uncharacterized protein n=2 Tax=Culex pipiens TaxID=7175 RepID=A0ABD1DW57_CULPP